MPAVDRSNPIIGDEAGGVLLEFTLVLGIFFLTVFGVVEFSYFIWQYAAASKGAQAALRHAAVSDPATRSSATLLPGSKATITCRLDDTATTVDCSPGPGNAPAMKCITDKLRGFAPFVGYSNIILEYRANDLGYPGHAAPTIELRLEDLQFPSLFLSYLGAQMLPALNYTITAEDMNSLGHDPDGNPDNNTTNCGAIP